MKVARGDPWLRDEHGRALILRGVNLSGSSKVPTRPNGATHIREGFFEHRAVSFVGRPFPLDQADEHFTRLRSWGLTTLRFLVTWEAVEHAGPGIYDEIYLDYLRSVVKKAGEYGFKVIIDPHQDVWSRFSGGDGAPGWTLEAAGLDLTRLHESGGAILHQIHGDPFPPMVWPTNNARLAAATMFTLFFGGNDFAPFTRVDGEPIQEYLQQHYIRAFQKVAECLHDLDCVIGYEVINEPMSGFIGLKDLSKPLLPVKYGHVLSPIQSMLLGDGIPQEIEVWEKHLLGTRLAERQWVNPRKISIWREGYDGVWRQNQVWDLDEKGRVRILHPGYFAEVNGRAVDFPRDYLKPFINRYAKAMREIIPEAIIFIESDPRMPPPPWTPEDTQNIVYMPHWYDASVLFLKTYTPLAGFNTHTGKIVLGPRRVARSFADQLALHKAYAARLLGNAPTIIGETGIAFDLNRKHAYKTGSFKHQIRAMERTLRAADDNLLGYLLWNYTPDNDNAHGDQWNGEDLSIYSLDQRSKPDDINSGGRALQAVIRPYPRATSGVPLELSFDIYRRVFTFAFQSDPTIDAPTEIFVPNYHYPEGYQVTVSDGKYEIQEEAQTLLYFPDLLRKAHQVRIEPA